MRRGATRAEGRQSDADSVRPVLEAREISKSFGPVRALRDVSFDVWPSEVHGLCGHNGAGKSTLVRIFVGLAKPDSGSLLIENEPVVLRDPQHAQSHGIALVDQELSLVATLTVEENLFLGGIDVPLLHRRRGMRERARELLDRIGLEHVALSERVERLAIGERQLVEIARLLSRHARVLILDEPTATLSEKEIELVFRAVREVVAQGKSVVYVSHRLGEVLMLCDRVSVFRDGQRVGTHSRGELDRSSLIELMLGEMEGESTTGSSERSSARERGGVELSIRNLSVPGAVRSFDLEARRGDIIGLAGQIGSGTTEVLRALGGLIADARGNVLVGGRRMRFGVPGRALDAGIIYVSNDRQREGLFLGQKVEENLVVNRPRVTTRLGVLSRARILRLASYLAKLLGVPSDRLRAPARQLSGGNQQKVLIGRCLEREDAHVFALDDPTRGVDVSGRAEIHRLIRHAARDGAVVLFASTELDEILELSDVIVTMFAGDIVSTHERGAVTGAAVLADMTMSRSAVAADMTAT
jgi:ABC-type sugar transport system ATPase subunit